MAEQAVRKPLSCIPCAKRKVRCDRLEPCSHCKRRKEDVCEYPLPNGSSAKTLPSEDLLQRQQERIEKLERYISESGGDPNRLQHSTTNSVGQSSSAANVLSANDNSVPSRGTKRSYDDIPRVTGTNLHSRPAACLVENDKQTTYIDAPVWYSWNEAKKSDHEIHETQQGSSSSQHPQTRVSSGYSTTLLDPPNAEINVALQWQHPSLEDINALWSAYLANVHPLIKIFFDWDKELLIRKVASDPASLLRGEQALIFAIYFMSTLSLSDEECKAIFNRTSKPSLLNGFQSAVETALRVANYAETSDLVVLQAFILYLVAMRNRANPATSFSLLGIAIRIAQRLGLHRDGNHLGLSPMQTEEKRRTWWHLLHMEISIGQLTGCLSLTLQADWDVKLPANLEDDDISREMALLPPDRHGLTSMSHCLWRYYVLHLNRVGRDSGQAAEWLVSAHLPMEEKDAIIERYRTKLAENFLQYCEPVNALHVHIQIGVQSFLLAGQRGARQSVSSTRISDMSSNERDEFLKICIKCMDYYIYGETNPLVAHFRWHNENYFQWTAFVYIVIEARYHANTPKASTIWTLIDKICKLHPKLTTTMGRPEASTIGHLILRAWHEREEYLREQKQNIEKPWCVSELQGALTVSRPNSGTNGALFLDELEDLGSLDFDFIDWSSWEMGVPPV